MSSLIQDIRYGWKLLWRDRNLTIVAVISLGLGIGANTTIFSVANAFLLRPLPVTRPERLVSLFGSTEGIRYAAVSYPDYVDWRDGNDVLSDMAAYAWIPMALKVSGAGPAEVISGELVTGNYFSVLGVEPVLGRAFLPEEDHTPGTHPVAVISHRLWKRRFGSEREVVGRRVRLNGLSFTVVGVAPEGFDDITVGMAPDVWVPLMMTSQVFPAPESLLDDRGSRWLQVVGRLKPGVSQGQAESAMKALASNLEREYPDANKGFGMTLVEANRNRIPLIFTQGVEIIGFMGVLLVLVGVVLLIACSNVASLLLARTSRRWREVALRQSLGAGRGRVVRQLLTESLMLSVAGGLAGLLVAVWGIDLLQTFEPPVSFPMTFDLSLDGRVLGYTALLSALTGVVFGLAPALQTTRRDQSTALNDPNLWLGFKKGRSRLRSFLVTAQVAFAVVSLVSAGLFLRSAGNARSIDPGFDTDRILCASLNLSLGQYDGPSGRQFFRDVVDRVEALPSVQSAALAQTVPLGIVNRPMTEISIDGYGPARDESMLFYYNSVGPRYFETLGIPIVKGRGIESRDRKDTIGVAVVNEAMARRFWRGRDAVGRTFAAGRIQLQVVGIAGNGKYITLGERPRPYFYVPLAQNYTEMVSLHVRTFGDPKVVATSVAREIENLDADLPLWDVKTMNEHLGIALFVPRTAGVTIGVFGLLALILAVTGVFGVLAYSVSQGTREFGVRMAMGARPAEILKLIMGKGFKTTLSGIVLGLLLASAMGGLLTGYLYDVSPVDALTFVGVPLVLLLTALVACYVPARRAARIDPNAALRHE